MGDSMCDADKINKKIYIVDLVIFAILNCCEFFILGLFT